MKSVVTPYHAVSACSYAQCMCSVLGTSVGVQKYRETNPQYFVVRGVRFDKCTGCMDCVEVCPNNAIQVSFNEGGAK